MSIPLHLLLPQDMVDMLDTVTGEVRRVHATAFKEAAERDDRFVLWTGKVAKASVEAGAEVAKDAVQEGAKVAKKVAKAATGDE